MNVSVSIRRDCRKSFEKILLAWGGSVNPQAASAEKGRAMMEQSISALVTLAPQLKSWPEPVETEAEE